MLEWTHHRCTWVSPTGDSPVRYCPGDKTCPNFPTVQDHTHHARLAWKYYANANGNSPMEFLQDVALLALADGQDIADLHEVVSLAFQESLDRRIHPWVKKNEDEVVAKEKENPPWEN